MEKYFIHKWDDNRRYYINADLQWVESSGLELTAYEHWDRDTILQLRVELTRNFHKIDGGVVTFTDRSNELVENLFNLVVGVKKWWNDVAFGTGYIHGYVGPVGFIRLSDLAIYDSYDEWFILANYDYYKEHQLFYSWEQRGGTDLYRSVEYRGADFWMYPHTLVTTVEHSGLLNGVSLLNDARRFVPEEYYQVRQIKMSELTTRIEQTKYAT